MRGPSYRNKFEKEVGEVLADFADYEPFKVPYVSHHTYTPDFVGYNEKRKKEILVEAKGYFREGDIKKYKDIRDSGCTINQELVFLLYSPSKKIRKGSKMDMGQWCIKEKLRWFTKENITDAFTK